MTLEITVLRLPVRLSDLVDDVVRRFVEAHANERVQAHRRYHDADLWMVFAHEPVGDGEPAFLTRRVTIGVYSDDPDYLRFIPDIVVTRPNGRFTLAYTPQENSKLRGHLDAISVLQAHLVSDRVAAWRELTDPHPPGSGAAALERAWDEAKRSEARQATQPII